MIDVRLGTVEVERRRRRINRTSFWFGWLAAGATNHEEKLVAWEGEQVRFFDFIFNNITDM